MNKSKVGFYLVSSITIMGMSIAAFADNGGIFTKWTKIQTPNTIDRVREAYSEVQSDPGIHEVLKDSNNNALSLSQRLSSSGIDTTKYQHYYKGLEVIGSMAFHHSSRKGNEVRDYLARFDLDTKPTLRIDEAASLAQAYASNQELKEEPALKILPSRSGKSANLIYWVKTKGSDGIAGRDVIIDAHSGAVIANVSHNVSIAPVQVFTTAGNTLSLNPQTLPKDPNKISPALAKKINASCQVVDSRNGSPLDMNLANCQQMIANDQDTGRADASARRASANSEAVLNYYWNHHHRNSFDDKGTDVVNLVHVGIKFDNAFWNTEEDFMSYGDGDGKQFKDFTSALDVAGHEMTHGVTAKTAQLESWGEPGALNEAYSDFFGKMVENQDNWVMGHDLALNGQNFGIRDLANPSSIVSVLPPANGSRQPRRVPNPDNVSQEIPQDGTCDDTNDNCWVHINSTIPGHASYLVAQAIGKQKAEAIYYLVLTQRLRPTASFEDVATETEKACADLYDSATCRGVKNAFAQVGL